MREARCTEGRLHVVFAAPPDAGVAEAVGRVEGVTVTAGPAVAGRPLAEVAARADVLVTRSWQRVGRDVLAAGAPRLRAVVQASAGIDNVDLEAAEGCGVEVVVVDPGNATAVAEHTLMSLLALSRNVAARWRATAAGAWPDREEVEDRELSGRTLGLVGIGRVGSRVATRALAFGMRVLATDPYLGDEAFEALGIERTEPLDAMLPRIDALSLHCPLTRETDRWIGASRLALLPRGALLVNTARGRIVEEAALVRALDCGHLAGAAIDVFEEEPPTGSPLPSHPRVLATPHLAGHTLDSHARRRDHLASTLVALAERLVAGAKPGDEE